MLKRSVLFFLFLMFMLQTVCLAASFSSDDFHYSVLRSSSVEKYLHMEFNTGSKNPAYTLQVNPQNDKQLILSIEKLSLKHSLDHIVLDGKFANNISFSEKDGTLKAVISLPYSVQEADYKAFLPNKDASQGRKNVLVVNISRKDAAAPLLSLHALANHTIVLDPGHGGSDSGAVGPDGVMEKDVTLAVAKKVYNILVSNGATVVMTRTVDKDVYAPNDTAAEELQARVNVGERIKGTDIFLSIHANSFSSPAAHGTETYYYGGSDEGQRLASLLQEEMIKSCGLADRGIAEADFYVLKHSSMPASLVELAFISNYKEENLLKDDTFQTVAAQAICRGLNRYFQGEN